MYDEYNFKTTLFIVPGWSPNWSGFRNARNNGHEIASHSMTHPFIYRDSLNQNRYELGESKRMIMEHMQSEYAMTFSYPFCHAEDIAMMKEYYIAARGCSNQIVSNTVEDFMNIGSFIVGAAGQYRTYEDFNEIAEKALAENGWSVYTFHSIDNPDGWSMVTSEDLRGHLDYLNEHRDVYWVDTFINVSKYAKERQYLEVIPTENSSSTMEVRIADHLNDDIYNIPLTFKKEVPQDWMTLSVLKDEEEIPYRRIIESSKTYVVFETVPDGGEIKIQLQIKEEAQNEFNE